METLIAVGLFVQVLLLGIIVAIAIRIKVQSDQHGQRLEQIAHEFNSKTDMLLEMKHAEGVREGEGGRGPALDAPKRPTGI